MSGVLWRLFLCVLTSVLVVSTVGSCERDSCQDCAPINSKVDLVAAVAQMGDVDLLMGTTSIDYGPMSCGP